MLDPLNGILRGEITDFYLSAKAMSHQDMIDFTSQDCRNTQSIFGNSTSDILIDWKNLNIVKEGTNTESIQLSVDEVCREKNEETMLIMSIKRNYSNSKYMCNLLGGNLFNPKSKADIENLPFELLKSNHLTELNLTDIIGHCGNLFWIPIRQYGAKDNTTGRYIWYQDIGNVSEELPTKATYLPWLFGQPNGGE